MVSIKSGPNWGNAAQHKKLIADFNNAVKVLKQTNKSIIVQPILGICYGNTKTSYLNNYWKLVGQNFWYFISGLENLYIDIIDPIGHNAKEHNEKYLREKGKIVNKFTKEFLERFVDDNYLINWDKLVEFNSGNKDIKVTEI